MTGLFGRSCLKKVKRIELPMGTRVISSRFHYKIKRHSAEEQGKELAAEASKSESFKDEREWGKK